MEVRSSVLPMPVLPPLPWWERVGERGMTEILYQGNHIQEDPTSVATPFAKFRDRRLTNGAQHIAGPTNLGMGRSLSLSKDRGSSCM